MIVVSHQPVRSPSAGDAACALPRLEAIMALPLAEGRRIKPAIRGAGLV